MYVRCKFMCTNKEPFGGDGFKVEMGPVLSGSAENENFFRYTPWGNITFGTINKNAADVFEPGKEYYIDISPAGQNIFEDINIANEGMSFGQAIDAMKAGCRVARKGWNGKGMWIDLQRPDVHSKMSMPYFYIEYPAGHPAYPNGSRVPWIASQTDMLAEDWFVLK